MKKLPPAQHRALVVAARREAQFSVDPYRYFDGGDHMQSTHENKLRKRGYLIYELRSITGKRSRGRYSYWLTCKAKQYLGR